MRERRLDALDEGIGDLVASHNTGEEAPDLAEYRGRPVAFIREILDGDPWRRQVEIAEAVRDAELVAVQSANGTGKDWLAARLALWWCYSRGGLALLTGPTRQQVEETLMRKEVAAAFRRAGELPGDLHVRALRPAGEGAAGVLAKTASEVSGLTGLHDAEVLVCISEAQAEGLDVAFEAAFANAVGADDRIFVYGNPLNPQGPFYRACQSSSRWRVLQVPASDVPNVREGETVVPGLMTREGVDRITAEYGEGSGYVQARVHAEFPDELEEGVFTREMIDAAGKRWISRQKAGLEEAEPLVAALDPARHGPDASVLAIRRGETLDELIAWEGRGDTMELAANVADALRDRGFAAYRKGLRQKDEFGRPERVGEQPARGRVVVDEVGVGGGVADRLSEAGFRVDGYNGGRSPNDGEQFHNRRSEAYWTLRERLVEGETALPPDSRLRNELLAVKWRATPQGKVQLERKVDLKARIGESPDRADAAVMAFAERRQSGAQKTARIFGI